ncbi:YueI family protein [Lactiplantibacillus plantarum]|nr:YueI family protein [Lactiplantibacillus plantarum]
MQNKDLDIDARVKNAVLGLPLLKPDEQNRCLGTFYERIELKITFSEAMRYDWTTILEKVMKKKRNYQLLFNGRLDMEILGQYIRLANRCAMPFLQLRIVSIIGIMLKALQSFCVLIMR